jgi:riboflavin biosynthesis pyrimidine reductase
VKDYATAENLIERDDPVFTELRFNPVPVRIVIDREGKVKHAHFLSAFPEQVRSISEALSRWRFKPYLSNGEPVEVETGLTFGRLPRHNISTPH